MKKLSPLVLLLALPLTVSCSNDSSEDKAPGATTALVSACRSFALDGGANAASLAPSMKNAIRDGWDPTTFARPFTELKAATAAAGKTEGLNDKEFKVFADFAIEVTRSDLAMTSTGDANYPTNESIEAFKEAYGEVTNLCDLTKGGDAA